MFTFQSLWEPISQLYSNIGIENLFVQIILTLIFCGTIWFIFKMFLKLAFVLVKYLYKLLIKKLNEINDGDNKQKISNILDNQLNNQLNHGNMHNKNLSLIELKTLELLTKNNKNENQKNHNLEMQIHELKDTIKLNNLERKYEKEILEIKIRTGLLSPQNYFNKDEIFHQQQQKNNQKHKEKSLKKYLEEIQKDIEDIKLCILSDNNKKTYYDNEQQTLFINPQDLLKSDLIKSLENASKTYIENKN